MLLFFDEYFDVEPVKRNRLHKVARTELRVMKLAQLAHMLFKQHGAGKIERLTQLVQNRHPALYIRGSCESELPHDFRLDFLTR